MNKTGSKNLKRHEGAVIDTVDGKDVIECAACGFKHVMPLPAYGELDQFYKQEYYQKEKPRYFTHSSKDQAWLETTYKHYFDLFDKYSPKKKRRLLEVGSGPGFFLKVGKELGWEVLGVEPSEQAAAFSKQFDVPLIHGFFEAESANKLGKFDLVFMDNVLEHLPDPVSIITLSKSVLNPGGILCIVSPNDYNPLQKILREQAGYQPWWVVPRHHINYFNFSSIKKLLNNQGFKVVEAEGTFPMEFFLLCGENYVGDQDLGREVHGKRKRFEELMNKGSPETLRAFYKFLGEQGIGRSFMVVATSR